MAIARLIGCVGRDHAPHEPQKVKGKGSKGAGPPKNEGAHGAEKPRSKQNASRRSSWEPVAKIVKDLSSSSMRLAASLDEPSFVPSNESFTEAEIAEAEYYNEIPNWNMARDRECMVPRPPRAEKNEKSEKSEKNDRSEKKPPATPPGSMEELRTAVARESQRAGLQSRPQRKLPPGSMGELRTAVTLETQKAGMQSRPLRVALEAFDVANRMLTTAMKHYETLEKKRDSAGAETERRQIKGELRELRGKLKELQSIKASVLTSIDPSA